MPDFDVVITYIHNDEFVVKRITDEDEFNRIHYTVHHNNEYKPIGVFNRNYDSMWFCFKCSLRDSLKLYNPCLGIRHINSCDGVETFQIVIDNLTYITDSTVWLDTRGEEFVRDYITKCGFEIVDFDPKTAKFSLRKGD